MKTFDLDKLRRQKVILDFLPFVYNIIIVINFFTPKEYVPLADVSLGFSLFVAIELLVRSIDNKYCIWHQFPIYNIILVCLFCIADLWLHISSLENYYLLYWVFSLMVLFSLFSLFMFLRKRFKKDCFLK